MNEAAFVFDKHGFPFYWHLPAGSGPAYIPDSRDLWEVLWENRNDLGGIAHSHPWEGVPGPSEEDVTTFYAIETGLGRRLLWPIVSMTHVIYLEFYRPGYGRMGYVDANVNLIPFRGSTPWFKAILKLREEL